MSIPITKPDDLPRVSISDFKANPVRYSDGAMVTNHGRDQFVFLPVAADAPQNLDSIKAQLLLLTKVKNSDDVARQLAELAASRDDALVDEPR